MKAYHIYLIRHGLTAANLEGKYIGATDVDLCEEGVQEIIKLREQYDYPMVGRVYSSPLRRSVQTARLLYPEMTPVTVDSLREYAFGVFENKTPAELKALPEYKGWMDSAQQTVPSGAEDPSAFGARVVEGLDRIIRDMMKNRVSEAAVVTHAGVITAILSACGLPRRPLLEWKVESGKGYTLNINAGLWANEHLVEVFTPVPYGTNPEEIMLDYQRTFPDEDESSDC